MLEEIFHLLSGYVEFQVQGDGARFFTVAAKRGLKLWGFRRENGLATAKIKPGTYKKLPALCRRCQARTKLIRKRGLPFQVLRLKKRKTLLLGVAAGAALYIFLSGSIWGVTLTGVETLPPKIILESAEAYGVFVGADRSQVDPKSAAQGVMARMPELSWVSVNTDGCFVEVAVKEGAAAPEVEDREELSNIVAGREGQIVELEAQMGRPEVNVGETVQAGQLLIAGLYQEEPDPYAAQPLEPFRKAGPARGKVVAETYREFTVQISARKTEPVETGRQASLWLELFDLRLPLGLWTQPEGMTRQYQETSRLKLLDVELPVGFRRETTVSLAEEERMMTEEEQKTAALLKLREVQKAELPAGSSVRQEELEYVFADGVCILNAKCRCLEEIGVIQIISVE